MKAFRTGFHFFFNFVASEEENLSKMTCSVSREGIRFSDEEDANFVEAHAEFFEVKDDSQEIDIAFPVGSKTTVCSGWSDDAQLLIVSDCSLRQTELLCDIADIISFLIFIHASLYT